MEDSVVLSSDSNPSSSPPTVLADLDDEIEFPSVKLSDICGSSNSSQRSRISTIWNPKDVSGRIGKAVGEKLSSAGLSRTGSPISVSDELSSELPGPSNAYRIHTNGNFTKTSSYHELSDSDSSDDTTKPTSQNGGISGAKGLRDSPILAHDDHERGKRTDAPLHELSDSDRTIPARNSPMDVEEDENSPIASAMIKSGSFPCSQQQLSPRRNFGNISDDEDSPRIYLSQSSFKLDVPSCDTLFSSRDSCDALLPTSRYSCDTLVPSRDSCDGPLLPSRVSCDTLPPSRSLEPFLNLSDDSTQPYPSRINPTDDGAIFQSNSEPLFTTSHSISEFITQLGANSQPQDLNNGPNPPRKRTKCSAEDILQRKRLKGMKQKEKAEKAAAAETLRRLRPGECLKYVTAVLDERIVTKYPWGQEVVRILELSDVKHLVKMASDPCTVQWTREQVGNSTIEESHVLFLWSIDKLLTSVQFGTFIDTFVELKSKYSTHKLLLAVYGLHEYYKKQHQAERRKKRTDASRNPTGPPARKTKSAYEITESQIELELIALQVRLGISHKVLNSPQDAAGFLRVITKSVAELPFKLERERIDEERNWYAKGDSRNCVRIDKDFNGLSQLWLQQLAQFNNSSLDTAKAVARIYPTPLAIYNEYKEKASVEEKEQMLQDIVVQRGCSGGGRRLGPELSKKISLMFCQDEDVPLG